MIELAIKLRSRLSSVEVDRPDRFADDAIQSPIRVTAAALIRLKEAAASLPLKSRFVHGQQGGSYLSAFKGRGMEFNETRPYQSGDDIRHLDWRVTARTGKPHTKLFCVERERPVFLWVDYRRPMFFATRGVYKSVIAAQAAALLAWSANYHGDRVGSIIFSEQIHYELKPQRGKSSVLRIIKHLAEHLAWRTPQRMATHPEAVTQALIRLRRVVRPGSLIFMISDFRGLNSTVESQLAHVSRHNDIVVLFIHDELEHHLPPAGRYRLSDEHREITLNTRDRKFSQTYQRQFEEHQLILENFARRYGIFFLSCRTTDNPAKILRTGLGAK